MESCGRRIQETPADRHARQAQKKGRHAIATQCMHSVAHSSPVLFLSLSSIALSNPAPGARGARSRPESPQRGLLAGGGTHCHWRLWRRRRLRPKDAAAPRSWHAALGPSIRRRLHEGQCCRCRHRRRAMPTQQPPARHPRPSSRPRCRSSPAASALSLPLSTRVHRAARGAHW